MLPLALSMPRPIVKALRDVITMDDFDQTPTNLDVKQLIMQYLHYLIRIKYLCDLWKKIGFEAELHG